MKIGVLGAGQLGRMLALAGYPLGLELEFLDPTPESPASGVGRQRVAPYTDPQALAELGRADVVTFEFENVPDEAAQALTHSTLVFPPPAALRIAQDRWLEKSCFQELGIRTPSFAAVDDLDSALEAARDIGFPCVIKTRRFGYDGKGQSIVTSPDDLASAVERLGGTGLILEEFVHYQRELSLIAARGRDGSCVTYPLIENQHRDGILRSSTAPIDVPASVAEYAAASVERLLAHLDYVGVLTVEFFDVGGTLLANEFAPRVHNSGHLTIEAAETSQFENHLRAIAGLPLGSTRLLCLATMVNLIGELPPKERVLQVPGAHYHDYTKEVRAGRKVGHITLTAANRSELDSRVAALQHLLSV